MRILTTLALSVFLLSNVTGQSPLVLTEIMYNSPGEDLEFLEFYNNSVDPLDLTGYAITEGVEYTFPDTILGPNTAFVVTSDSCKFNVVYRSFLNSPVEEWTGTLNNGGERITVIDANQSTIIDVTYNDTAPWPILPDGFGPSIILCDPNTDMTQGENWKTNYNLSPDIMLQGARIFADPNLVGSPECIQPNDFWLSNTSINYFFESNDTIEIPIYRESASMETDTFVAGLTEVLLTEGMDYEVISDTLIYSPGQTSPEFFTISLIDDATPEDFGIEFLDVFSLGGAIINTFTITSIVLIDNDGPLTEKLELRGVLENSDVKALEFFLKSDLEIGGLSNFSLGAANNGNGSDGTEHHLDLGFVPTSECFFIANDTVRLKKFMGWGDGEVTLLEIDNFNFNGNDAIELFEKDQLIDVFGFQNEDGEGTVWEYTDGWAKKIIAGNSTSFDENNWNYGGVASIDVEQNSMAPNPYPLECLPTSVSEVFTSEVALYPNPTDGQFTLEAAEGITSVSIFSATGVLHYENRNLNSRILNIDMSAAQTGLYLVRIRSEDKVGVKRLIIE